MVVVVQVRVNEHGGFFQRLGEIEHGLQFLVRHLDEFCRALRGFFVARNNGRDLLADETHAVGRKNVTVLHVQTEAVRKFLAGHDAHDARGFFRRGRVDALDQRVRERAFDNFRVEEVRSEIEVVNVLRRACNFVQAVDAARRQSTLETKLLMRGRSLWSRASL